MSRLRLLPGATVVLLLVGATATACSDRTEPDDQVTITVETANWNGWDEDDQGEVETTTVEVAPGETFDVPVTGGSVEFTLVEADDRSVDLETDSALVESADGAIDFDAATDEFTLATGDPLELITPTMDAGTTIMLTLG